MVAEEFAEYLHDFTWCDAERSEAEFAANLTDFWQLARAGVLTADLGDPIGGLHLPVLAQTKVKRPRDTGNTDFEFNAGDNVYWDNTNKRATKIATDNTLIGIVFAAVGSGSDETTDRVRLNGSF